MTDAIVIRPASEDDGDFVLGLVASLLEFGSPLWQDPRDLAAGFKEVLARAVREQNRDAAVLIAEAADNTRLGFISIRAVDDLVTGDERAHVADLAVAPAARRSGVGRALMTAGESWARDRGVAIVTLDVWSTNHRALAFYRALGYPMESLSLAKHL